jgi:dihydrolipoamide dehydrogenase
MDSRAALELDGMPEQLAVVGGGYVGLELGMVYAALGSKVTLFEMADRILPNADPDLVRPLAKSVEEAFEAVHTGIDIGRLEERDEGVVVPFEDQQQQFDRVLVAIGRLPNSEDLGLEQTGAGTDERGFIEVDQHRRSGDQRIFAIGDVAGGKLLAHEAIREGRVAAEVIAGQPAAFDPRAVPAVVFTDPQLAWCGLTEQSAAADGREIEVSRFRWSASGRARSVGSSQGLTKLICEPKTGRVLGMGIVGRGAESMISEGVLAIEMGAVGRDLASSIHPHPTLSETLEEAAELLLGSPTHTAPRVGTKAKATKAKGGRHP